MRRSKVLRFNPLAALNIKPLAIIRSMDHVPSAEVARWLAKMPPNGVNARQREELQIVLVDRAFGPNLAGVGNW